MNQKQTLKRILGCGSLLLATLLAYPLTTEAAWSVSSEFKLRLDASVFDSLLRDFWKTLNGDQSFDLPNIATDANPVAVQINGIHVGMHLDLGDPKATGQGREWELLTRDLSATLTVDSVNASQIIEKDIDGIHLRIRLNGECHNLRFALDPGLASASTRIRANLTHDEVRLALSQFAADWKPNSWRLVSMSCSGADGFDKIVADQAMQQLSTLHNFDIQLQSFISQKLANWSQSASQLLLSSQEIPSGRPDLSILYEPTKSQDNVDGSIQLAGTMHFVFTSVSPDDNMSYAVALDPANADTSAQGSSLVLPFETLSLLVSGSFFSSNYAYTLQSNQLSGFVDLMHSSLAKSVVWPDLNSYKPDDVFLFKSFLFAPPSFQGFAANPKGGLAGQITLPIVSRVFAPRDGSSIPYVEFRAVASGPAQIQVNDHKVKVILQTDSLPLNAGWSKSYVDRYKPNPKIDTKTIQSYLLKALQQQGLDLPLPQFKIGAESSLQAEGVEMHGTNLRIPFSIKTN